MAYTKIVADNHSIWLKSREVTKKFNHWEVPSASRALGDISGLRVLDLACGDGRFTRWLKTSKQAAEVVGVDMSAPQIQMARDRETKEPLGIQYHVGDASKPLDMLEDLGQFDVVFAAWLLIYATDKNMLKQFLVNVHNYVKEGGIFVTITSEPDYGKKFGEEMNGISSTTDYNHQVPPQDGGLMTIGFYAEGRHLFDNTEYWWSLETYKNKFEEVGFKNFTCASLQYEGEEKIANEKGKRGSSGAVLKASK